jgi:hypothetical protein
MSDYSLHQRASAEFVVARICSKFYCIVFFEECVVSVTPTLSRKTMLDGRYSFGDLNRSRTIGDLFWLLVNP